MSPWRFLFFFTIEKQGFEYSFVLKQSHGHSHYPSTDSYSTAHQDVEEEGEKEKLQHNGEANNLALGKVDAGEGELMLSPAQTPQVRVRAEDGLEPSLVYFCLFFSLLGFTLALNFSHYFFITVNEWW